MKQTRAVVAVAKEHIEPGIQKYKGELDKHLQAVIKAAGLSYIPYTFNNGRVLLVMPETGGGFLYKSEEEMEKLLNIEK